MTKIYRSRSGQITAIDTKTQLTTLGSETSPGKLDVPEKAKKLSAAIVAFAGDNASAVGVSSAFVRIEGPGIPNGAETLAVGHTAGFVATGQMHRVKAVRLPLGKDGVSITNSEEVQIFGEVVNEDLGAYEMAVTLEFKA